MPPLLDRIIQALTTGGDLTLVLDRALNTKSPGSVEVFLHEDGVNAIRVDLTAAGGEAARILWLPWMQGEVTEVYPGSIDHAPDGTLFLTFYLTGCKVFAIQGGPVWHIDAMISVDEFWPRIASDEWVEDNWALGTTQNVAYLRRAGQSPNLWDLSAYLQGAAPTTYGHDNVGQAVVGGVVNRGLLTLYYQSSPWAAFPYAKQLLKKT